jgi:hypothetical protein
MSLFHRHEDEDSDRPADADSFEVLGPDDVLVRYSHDDFDMIVETTDPEEVQRQTELGWLILDERQVEHAGRGPSGDDLLVGIEGLRAGGLLGYEAGTSVTQYTIGYLRDGAQGEPAK